VRTVLATYDDDPPEGGQGVHVRGLRAALVERGVEVRTVSGRGAHAIAYPRILHRAPLDFSLALSRDPSPLLRDRPDVVHAQGGPGGVLLLPRRALPVPLVYTAHHTYIQAYPSRRAPQRLLAPLERRAYVRAAAVLAVSPSTASAVRAMGVAHVEVVPPGIDVDALAAPAESRRDPRLMLFVGRLEPEKGPLDAVAAMRAVAEQSPGAHGVVVGRGRLDAQVRAAAGSAVEVRGAVPDDELRDLYGRAAVVLMPSRYEGLGMVALEAMAAGAVVVGYDVTGLRDAAAHGILVPPGDVAALADAVRALLADPARWADLSHTGRTHIVDAYSWTAAARHVEQIYESVTSRALNQ
jgi:glycogen synthase